MVGQTFAEFRNVVPAALARFVGRVKGYADIEAEDEETQVVADAQTRADGKFAQIVEREFRAGACWVAAEEPHVARIKEDGCTEVAEDGGAQFEICLQFDVACLVYVGVFAVGRFVAARADGAHGKAAHAVGSAHVELVGIGGAQGVAVAVDGTCEEAAGQLERRTAEAYRFVVFGCGLDVLCEGIAEEVFVLFAEGLAAGGVDG